MGYAMIKSAFEFEAIVSPNGTIEVAVPVPPGTKVEVLVLTSDDGDWLSFGCVGKSGLLGQSVG